MVVYKYWLRASCSRENNTLSCNKSTGMSDRQITRNSNPMITPDVTPAAAADTRRSSDDVSLRVVFVNVVVIRRFSTLTWAVRAAIISCSSVLVKLLVSTVLLLGVPHGQMQFLSYFEVPFCVDEYLLVTISSVEGAVDRTPVVELFVISEVAVTPSPEYQIDEVGEYSNKKKIRDRPFNLKGVGVGYGFFRSPNGGSL